MKLCVFAEFHALDVLQTLQERHHHLEIDVASKRITSKHSEKVAQILRENAKLFYDSDSDVEATLEILVKIGFEVISRLFDDRIVLAFRTP